MDPGIMKLSPHSPEYLIFTIINIGNRYLMIQIIQYLSLSKQIEYENNFTI